MSLPQERGTRVVITGIGPVSPRAVSRESLGRLLEAGAKNPARTVPGSDSRSGQSGCAVLRITKTPPSAKGSSLRQIDALGRLAVDATELAWADARLALRGDELNEVGVAFGTAYGCLEANTAYLEGIRQRGSRFGNPVVFQNTVPNAATGYASLVSGIRGPTATFSSGVVAGLQALDFALGQIREGRVHTAVAGSADQLCAPIVDLYRKRQELSSSGVCRPFDRRRDGTILSDGACALVLEKMDRATARGATLYAEILSVGEASEFCQAPWRALGQAIRAALAAAWLEPEEIDVVFSGANGSVGDVWESRGLEAALGQRAGMIPVTCPKSHLGDTQASGGILAVATAAMALAAGRIPTTANYREKDPDCHLRIQADEETDSARASVALVCALSQDGNASAAILRRYSA